MQFIIQQIQFGVKCSAHAVELCTDLVERLNAEDLAKMVELFKAKLATMATQTIKAADQVEAVAVKVADLSPINSVDNAANAVNAAAQAVEAVARVVEAQAEPAAAEPLVVI